MFSKTKLLLSVPGALFALAGIFALSDDTAIALLIIVWGLMLMPVFWVFIENKFQKSFSVYYRLGLFVLAFALAGIFSPAPEQTEDRLSGEAMSELIEETIATTPRTSPDIFSNETGELLPSVAEDLGVEEADGEMAEVVDVVDGDTLKVLRNGRVETIRVIGIDTPETVHPNGIVECFGYEASAQAETLLTGTTVRISTDSSQGIRDKYDRYLAYITLPDGRDFGEVMLRGGYAYEYTYGVPYTNQVAYKAAERYAAENEQGLWADGACGGLRAYETEESVVLPVVPLETTASTECDIKGNISYNSGEKIYHVPGQQNYRDTVINEDYGERWFCSESEALAAGWRKAKR